MTKRNTYCDFCNVLCMEDNKIKAGVNGFAVELGYSLNGWGNRNDFVTKTSYELCPTCFEQVAEKSKEMAELIKRLRK